MGNLAPNVNLQDSAFGILGNVYGNVNIHSRDDVKKRALRDALRFDDMYVRADQLGQTQIPSNSFDWIWSTTFRTWLGQPASSDPLYWIHGKPGSGKSTLVQYLVNCRQTKEYFLPQHSGTPIILRFFFDYRANLSAANSESGLIKMFLTQLCDRFEHIESRLADINAAEPIWSRSHNRLVDLFCEMLENAETSGVGTCVFVDGLDEYAGDWSSLVLLLKEIQRRAAVKLCLACRSEPLFQKSFGQASMVRMQDHNQASLAVYLRHRIDDSPLVAAHVKSLLDDMVREEIINRAQGVIIWARLAVDSLLHLARETSTDKETLLTALEALPEELSQMYDRMFERILKAEASETASLLVILHAFDGNMDLRVLYGMWDFLRLDQLGGFSTSNHVPFDQFLQHLLTLLGSFVDVLEKKRTKTDSPTPDRHFQNLRKRGSRVAEHMKLRSPKVYTEETIFTLRLMHKTTEPWITSSVMVHSALPETIKSRFPDCLRVRLCTEVIIAANAQGSFDLEKLQESARELTMTRHRTPGWGAEDYHCWQLGRQMIDPSWKKYLHLLSHCLRDFPRAAHSLTDDQATPLYTEWKTVLKSPLMFFADVDCSSTFDSRDIKPCLKNMDLVRAVEYVLPIYIKEVTYDGEEIPEPSIWNSLFSLAVKRLLRDEEEDFISCFGMHSTASLARLLHLVRANCNAIEERLLDNFYYSTLTDDSRLEEKAGILCEVLLSPTKLAMHKHVSSADDCGCVALLPSWIYASSWVMYRLDRGGFALICVQMLMILTAEDSLCNINTVCPKHGTLLHILVDLERPYNRNRHVMYTSSLVVLSILAKLGIDPNVEHNGLTPLQTLQSLVNRRLRAGCIFTRHPNKQRRAWLSRRESLGAMIEALQYHQDNGSWPDFQQLAERWVPLWTASLTQIPQSRPLRYRDETICPRLICGSDQMKAIEIWSTVPSAEDVTAEPLSPETIRKLLWT